MKSLKYIQIKLLFVITILMISCAKNVNLQPTDSIPTEAALQNFQDYDKAVIGAYSNIAYQQTIYVNTLLADESRWGLENNTRNYGLSHKWQFSATENDATSSWSNLYNVIDRVNRALSFYDAIATSNANEKEQLPRLKGELLAIRAFAHFELLRWFSADYDQNALGVTIMTESSVFDKPARSTFGEVISVIKSDLEEADKLIPTSFNDLFRITKPAVAAIRARVALYNKDWSDAITFANQALATKGTLQQGDNYKKIWNDSNTDEIIFHLRRSENAGSIRTLWTDDNTDVFFSPSYKLMATFDKVNDIRYPLFFLEDVSVAATREKWKVNKYPGQNANDKFNFVKVFRISELYLIAAEAYAENNNLTEGINRLNALRAARITGYTNQTITEKQALINEIYTERFKELAFEGHRFFDLKRRKLSIIRDNKDIESGNSIPLELKPTDRNYILPIPQGEIFANPNMKQNPGYGIN